MGVLISREGFKQKKQREIPNCSVNYRDGQPVKVIIKFTLRAGTVQTAMSLTPFRPVPAR